MSDDITLPVTGGCACGSLRYILSSAPSGSVRCFCRQCQQASGGGHSDLMIVSAPDLAVSGKVATFSYTAASGNKVEKSFCPDCGCPVASQTAGHPDLRFLFAATLDRPGEFTAGRPVYTEEAQPWDPPPSGG